MHIPIKSLLIGMLACSAMVACTNEDPIDAGNEELKQSELTRGDAYVNFVINTKTDSSRGITTEGTGNSGDIHGGADDSGHHVEGLAEENAVNEVLVVITKVADVVNADKKVTGYTKQDNGMAELYETIKYEGRDKVANGYIGTLKPGEGGQITVNGTSATMNEPIRLDYTGHYAIAVVVNPVAQLKSDISALGEDHQAAYEKILEFDGEAYDVENVKDFQMSNKTEIIVNATPSNNTPANPAKPENPVSVERTVSKATWRWTEPLTDAPTEELQKMNNLYPVTVKVKAETPVTDEFWYKKVEKDTEGTAYDTYYYSKEFHKATTVDNKIYWILFKKEIEVTVDGQTTNKVLTSADYLDEEGKIIVDYVEAIFADEKEDEMYTGVIDDTDYNDKDDENNDQNVSNEKVEIKEYLLSDEYYSVAVPNVTDAMVQSLAFVYITNEDEPTTKTYYVHLTHYALTNLTTSVYAVRHIDNRQFGILDDGEYLVTPAITTENPFKQTLAEVKDDASKVMNGVFTGTDFVALPTTNTDGTANNGHATTDKNNNSVTYSNVGGFMQYLYENSCAEGVTPTANNVTGIVLAGDIYDETGAKVDVLYKYNHRFFRTLQALLEDEENAENPAFANLTPNSTDDAVKKAGIDIYPEGRCFYYSAQIKHFDDGIADNIGVMEYAIMRNNIYSLGVKSIKEIGDASLNLTPNTPISDIRSYVELEVSILPWIVRFNDLEL